MSEMAITGALGSTYWRRMRAVYRSQRRSGKAPVTILLELVVKHLLGKTAHTFLLKIRLAKYCLPTERAFLKTLLRGHSKEAMLGRRHLSSRQFFVDPTDQGVWQEYQQRFAPKWPTIVAEADSAVLGPKGNRERFLYASRRRG